MTMEHKVVPFEIKAVDSEGRTFEGYASTFRSPDKDEPDFTGDMVCPGAFRKTISERGHKVRMLWQHDPSQPIGKWTSMREDDAGLYVKGQISDTSLGRDVMALLKDGAVDSMSIGYEPVAASTEYGKTKKGESVRLLRELKLWEVSLVSFPADTQAKVLAVKAAIPPHATDKADEGTAWDAGAVLKMCKGAEQLRRVHAWVDPDGDPEAKASYKLPHHMADGKVVWRGVAAAAARMNQMDIPEGDMAGVRAHMAAHYRQFSRPVPWQEEGGKAAEPEIEDAFISAIDALLATPALESESKVQMMAGVWAARALVLEAKAGRRLSARSQASIRAAIAALHELLGDVETEETDACDKPEDEEHPHKPMKEAPVPTEEQAAPVEIKASDSENQGEPGADPPTAVATAAGPVTTSRTSGFETRAATLAEEMDRFRRSLGVRNDPDVPAGITEPA